MAEINFNDLQNLSDIESEGSLGNDCESYPDTEEYYSGQESDIDEINQNAIHDEKYSDDEKTGLMDDEEDDDLDDTSYEDWTNTEYIVWLEERSESDNKNIFEQYDKNTENGIQQLVLIAKKMLGHIDDDIPQKREWVQGLSDNIKDKLKLKKITLPILTKYERTLLLSSRAQQIANGSEILISIQKVNQMAGKVPLYIANKIAQEELKLNRIPFIIRRNLPNNTEEYWKVSELLNIEE